MAFTTAIKNSNINENWLFELEYYNGDSGGDGGGGFGQIFRSDGTTANLLNEPLDNSETSILVDNNTMFEVGDFIKVDDEVMEITAVNSGAAEITVIRASKSTTKATHNDNSVMYWHNYLPLSFSDMLYKNTLYRGVITNKPSLRESLSLDTMTSKSSNITIQIPDFEYKGSLISKELFGTHKYINRACSFYSSINHDTPNKIASFRISDIVSDGYTITISLSSYRVWDNITIPQTKTTTKQNYFPIVYGDYTGTSSTQSTPTYVEGMPKTLFPVQVDARNYYYNCLLHSDLASTDVRLRYYESGFDAFVPLETYYTSESYENGVMVRADIDLKRHFKFKPTNAISKTFSDVANLIDGTVDQTISDSSATLTMDSASGSSTNTLTKDNIFNIPAFDDPPDASSSSSNNGFTIEVRWRMDDLEGTTSNSNGLLVNRIQIYNNSRYATGNVSDSVSSGTVFGTNGTYNGSLTSGTQTDISEVTSNTSGSVTATEFRDYGYENGISIRFLRLVTSATDGSGGSTANIEGDLIVGDVRCSVTCKIDRLNDTTDAFSRIRSIDYLYVANDGLNHGITGLSSMIDLVPEAHLDLLNRFCGIDVATNPNTNIDGWQTLLAARANWDIRWWIHEPELLEKVLNQMQYEGQFIFRFKQGDFTQPQYIHIPNSPSSILTLSKNDIANINLSLSNPADIITKTNVSYDKHPALGNYQSTVTGVNATSRKNYNIQSKENIKDVNLDMLVNNIGDTDPTGEDKNDNFLAYQNSLFGDIYLMVSFDIVNPSKWVDSSLDPIEVGDIIDFDNTNMFPETPLGFNSASWSSLNFIITDTTRTLGKLSVKARSV